MEKIYAIWFSNRCYQISILSCNIMMMKQTKQKALEQKGWRIGSAGDFLDLSDEEIEIIDLKIALEANQKDQRLKNGMNEVKLAVPPIPGRQDGGQS